MTPRPGRIDRILPVPLDRPRDRSSRDFLHLRGDILQLLHFAGNGGNYDMRVSARLRAQTSTTLHQ